MEHVHNIVSQTAEKEEYTEEEAVIMAIFINEMNNQTTEIKKSFLETYSLKQGIKKFGEKGYNAAFGEMLQLHQIKCFRPVGVSEMTNWEKKRALESLIFLVEKRDGRVKGRTCANGSVQREWVDKKDASSSTAYMESIMLTATIDAEEERDVATIDIPNFFIHTLVERKPGEDKIVLKIRGVLVDMLMQMDPELYGPLIVYENGKKVLYTEVLQAIYGMLQSALLAYKKLRKDLKTDGFVFNPYDLCVANKKIDGENLTVLFHVDDLKVSHKDRRVVDQFEQWVDFMYGDPKIGKIKAVRGKVHEYLAMTLDYTKKGEVKIEMKQYVQNMLDTFPIKFKDGDAVNTPAADNLFKVDGSKPLEKNQAELFHTTVAKALFLCKRARPDIQPIVAFLCTRVKQPNRGDWKKLLRLMKYLSGTKDMGLRLRSDKTNSLKWYADAAFAVHPDFKSHTGATLSMGDGAVLSMSRKQKLNTKSSTEAELVGADDVASLMLWTRLFLQAQGYRIDKNILFQGNKSTILLVENGKKSSSKRTRHLNIRYFFLMDQVQKGNLTIRYCPTDDMIADFMSKPLQGKKFRQFRKDILNLE